MRGKNVVQFPQSNPTRISISHGLGGKNGNGTSVLQRMQWIDEGPLRMWQEPRLCALPRHGPKNLSSVLRHWWQKRRRLHVRAVAATNRPEGDFLIIYPPLVASFLKYHSIGFTCN